MNLSRLIAQASRDGFHSVTAYPSHGGLQVHRARRGNDAAIVDTIEFPQVRLETLAAVALGAREGLKAVGWDVTVSADEVRFCRNPHAAGRAGTLIATELAAIARKAA